MRRAQEGDDVAFAQLVRTLRPHVLRWATLQLSSADDAEDVAQIALLGMHRQLRSFRGEARFTTWLYSIVRRAAADWRRARRRLAAREHAYATDASVVVIPETDATDVDRRLRAALDLMRTLPVRQREAFDLIDLQGNTYDAAAALLGLSPSTVRVHVLRARRAIRARMLERPSMSEVKR
ncbi:MAG TPA: RNA polymerase sigma factor [Longimicrobiales bacterium]